MERIECENSCNRKGILSDQTVVFKVVISLNFNPLVKYTTAFESFISYLKIVQPPKSNVSYGVINAIINLLKEKLALFLYDVPKENDKAGSTPCI